MVMLPMMQVGLNRITAQHSIIPKGLKYTRPRPKQNRIPEREYVLKK